MSIVKEQIDAGIQIASTIQGALSILKGVVLQRFNFWLERMADLNMTDVEKVKLIAEDYIGVNLTPSQCSAVKGILGLQAVVTSYGDIGLLNDFERAIVKNPQGMKAQADIFILSAKKNITMSIVHAWKDYATNEIYTKDFKIKALVAFGMDENTAKRCEWSGKSVMTQDGNPVDFYGLAGVDAYTFLPY